MERAYVLKILKTISDAFQGFNTSKDIIDIWEIALEDIDYETAYKNLLNHIKTSSNYPKPADINKPLPKMSYHEIGKQTLLEYTKEVKENRERAIPCPPEIKEELRKFFEKGD